MSMCPEALDSTRDESGVPAPNPTGMLRVEVTPVRGRIVMLPPDAGYGTRLETLEVSDSLSFRAGWLLALLASAALGCLIFLGVRCLIVH